MGLAAIDVGSGKRIMFDAGSRYAMASTVKLALAALVLANVEAGRISLTDKLTIRREHLLAYAPVTLAAGVGARLSIEQLCAAIVEVSDNGAANMLLERIGGPPEMTAFFRRCGDQVTRLDRIEPELNSNLPGDPRDTTSPAAMLQLMRTLLIDGQLQPQSRQRLAQWLVRSSRGLDRLRAGLPPSWKAGSKAGTGAGGATNDLVIAWPPGRQAILIACYLDAPGSTDAVRAAVHREAARRIAAAFA
jgi:beta-lactamase class A